MNKIKQEIKMIECKSCKKPFKMKTRRINYHELNRLKKIKYNIIKWFKNVLNKRFFVNFQICYKCHKKLKKKKISCKNSGIVYWDNECGDICKFHPILNHYKHCIDCKNYLEDEKYRSLIFRIKKWIYCKIHGLDELL